MRALILAAAAALSLGTSACNTIPVDHAPAPLASTIMDEKALLYAWESYDFVLTTVDELRDAGKIVPGTDKAHAIQGYLIKIKAALTAASAARKAGSATSYETAFAEAQVALAQVKSLIK